MAFLNNEGVQHLWDKVVDALKGKANKKHKHGIEAVTGLQTALDAKVANPDLASVGQTIIVKEVDANGKPTKWESAEYQPKILVDKEILVYENTLQFVDGTRMFAISHDFSIGTFYKVIWNGTEYICECLDGSSLGYDDAVAFGNVSALLGAGNTGEPFAVAYSASQGGAQAFSLDGSVEATMSIYEPTEKIEDKHLDLDWIPKRTLGKGREIFAETAVSGQIFLDYFMELEDGAPYVVTFNGKEYPCTTLGVVANGYKISFLGNPAIIFDDSSINTGEPFVIANMPMSGEGSAIATTEDGTVKVNCGFVYDQIPFGYVADHLPEQYHVDLEQFGFDGVGEDDERKTFSFDTTKILDVLANDGRVYVRFHASFRSDTGIKPVDMVLVLDGGKYNTNNYTASTIFTIDNTDPQQNEITNIYYYIVHIKVIGNEICIYKKLIDRTNTEAV